MANNNRVKILFPNWCKACGICVQVCPTNVLSIISNRITITDEDGCIGCGNCELICPDFVLKVVEENDEEKITTG